MVVSQPQISLWVGAPEIFDQCQSYDGQIFHLAYDALPRAKKNQKLEKKQAFKALLRLLGDVAQTPHSFPKALLPECFRLMVEDYPVPPEEPSIQKYRSIMSLSSSDVFSTSKIAFRSSSNGF